MDKQIAVVLACDCNPNYEQGAIIKVSSADYDVLQADYITNIWRYARAYKTMCNKIINQVQDLPCDWYIKDITFWGRYE